MTPLFSVITPVYNKLPHLERSVHSVINQTYKNFELILIDDASTDGSGEKLLEFEDERIKIYKRDVPGAGGYAARNLGVARATSEWVCFLDADDEWEPDVLETVGNLIHDNSDAELICWGWYRTSGDVRIEDHYTKKYKKEIINKFNLTDFFIGPQVMWMGAVCIKKQLIERAGLFPEEGFKRGGDFDTWVRCVIQSKGSFRICKPMSYYHIDSVNMITKNVERSTAFLYTPHLLNILKTTKDEELKVAIYKFQNSYLYLMLNGFVFKGEPIRYKLLAKMNLNRQALWLITKLHLNRMRFLILGAPGK